MASIVSSTGSSGLPIDSLVSAMMTSAQQPITQIKTQVSTYNAKLSAYGTLKSGLSTFQTALDGLSSAGKFNAQSVTLTDSNSISATANGSATNGNHSISVSQLATSQRITTSAYSDASTTFGTGSLKISFGTYTPANGSTAASFTANSSKNAITVNIDSSNNTLSGIRDAINAQNASVTASIVNDGTGNRLVITSMDTGAANSLKIDVTDNDGNNTDGSGLSTFAYDPTASSGSGKNLSELQAAQNALLTVDGLSISKASNTITDVIEGVTLNLKAVTSTPNAMTIATDNSAIKSSVQSFVDAYNKLNTSLRSLTKFVDGGSSANGPLLGDSVARDVSVKLGLMMSRISPTASTYRTLSDIGVTVGDGGVMTLDDTKFQKAMANSPSDVAKIFSPSASSTDPLVSFVSSGDKTVSGTYAVNISQAGSSSQDVAGTLNGVNAIGSGNTLTGAFGQNSAGLKLSILGAATGDRGTVTFNRGLIGEFSSMLDSWLDSDAALATRTDGLQSSIKSLNKKADDLSAKLPSLEASYRAQYAKLDALLSSMQTQSSALTQQLSAISKNS
ncbi:flagellar filament capping protein FliD [Methylophilus sp. YYY-1]|uniref:Flagellar hook-associated protein 2 n=1 Tax=Methylophilus glucosoxydans TaxID=752553 RepID=A0ABW3GJ14_9PROT|nr:flagellar filament capping protein FliD [Methylophilus sp. YYY-1]MDF0376648.1 flagellar filament capping protein FliD [Methylophilus sp. YYY-1]